MLRIVGRVLWAICCACFVLLVPSSASWAATDSLPSSHSVSALGTSSFTWADDEPSPSPTPEPSPSPEPEPTPSPSPDPSEEPLPPSGPSSMMGAGTEDDPTIVALSVEQMSLILGAACLIVICSSAVAVMTIARRS